MKQRVDSASRQCVAELLARHVKDYQSLFRRFSLDVGTTPPDLLAKTTLARLEAYTKVQTTDPQLEALFCQYGRYLLISCSRPGSLPANLQGVWNDSNEPAWAGDYHSNINLEMNYWPAEPTNLAECHQPFIDYVTASARSAQEHAGNTARSGAGPSRRSTTPAAFRFGNGTHPERGRAASVGAFRLWPRQGLSPQDRLSRAQGSLPVLGRPPETARTARSSPDGWSPEHGTRRKA